MWSRIKEIIRKEFRQVFRDRRARLLLFVPPIMQLLVFGFAVNLDVENGGIGWFDQDQTPASRELLASFDASPYIHIAAIHTREDEIHEALDHGAVQAVVQVPPGFGRDLERGKTATVQILIEGTNSNTASILSTYLNQIVARHSRQVFAEMQTQRLVGATTTAGGPVNLSPPALGVKSRVWFNAELRSRNYFVPGVIANIITLITLMLTALALVREREIGTMEQLMVTPIRPIELMLGKTLPFALVGLIDVLIMTILALVVFDVPFRGSGWLLLLSSIIYLLTSLGIGLFISTVSHTQQQAVMSSFFFFQPAFMLSGFAFPIRNMPEYVQYVTYLNPIRYFMEIVRGIFLKGVGIDVLWPQLAALLILGIGIFGFSALRFHKRLD
jgi:ABC-2 type transport system permease protein